ncbi:MAG: CBS domain-containing protein [Acidobacteriota bacterium]
MKGSKTQRTRRKEPVTSKARKPPAQSFQTRLEQFPMLLTESVMTTPAICVGPQDTLAKVEELFETHDFNSLPVVDGSRLIGIVTKFDFLKNFIFTAESIIPHYSELMRRRVIKVMTREVCIVHPSTPVTRVLQMMIESRNKSFPVVDDSNSVVGVISRGNVIKALRG